MRILDFGRRLEDGLMMEADSLDRLAQMIEVPADVLRATVDEYNGFVDAGEDPLLPLLQDVRGGLRRAPAGLDEPPQPLVDGFTPPQRFFLAWAQMWCENATQQDFLRRAQEDTHATGRWRANGVLMNLEEFRKAFDCAPGTPMAPATSCRVW